MLLLAPRPAAAGCAGDCGGDDEVTVDELLTLVNIALDSAPLTRCQGADAGGDGRISVDDLVRAVNNALAGCFPRQCVPPPAGLVAWYPLDEGGGSEVRDLAPAHHTGTAGAGPLGDPDGPQPVPGMVGGALSFAGPSRSVAVPDAAGLNFAGGDFSIDAWVEIAADAPSGVLPLVDKRDRGGRGGGVRGYELFLFNGRLGAQLADAATADNTCASSGAACTNYVAGGPSLADGQPHHVALTVRRASRPALTLYVDGVPVLSDPHARSGSVDNAAALLIARSDLAGLSFSGWLDELEIFSRALDADEVEAIARAGAAGKCRPLEHYFCYRTRPREDGQRVAPIPGVRVTDQFGTSVGDVDPSLTLCAPANKNDEDPDAPADADHLRAYPMRPRDAFTTVPGQKVVNQFGTLFVDVLAPSVLMVPTAKNLSGTPEAPRQPAVDHFLCHAVQLPRGAAPFAPIPGVRVEDQFGARVVDVIAPTRLCAPADKNGEAPAAPRHPAHLMCYQVALSPRVIQPPDGQEGPPDLAGVPFESPVDAVYTNNQFGPDVLQLVDVEELCVPSLKNTEGDAGEVIDCDDGIFCTEDRVVTFEPEADFEPPPSPTPGYTPPLEQGCAHDWKHGAAFGDWLHDREGTNITPCCEASSDCDDGNPCTHDVCVEGEHRCQFEVVDPEECDLNPIAPVMPVPSGPCLLDEGLEARLCDITCVPGQVGEDCPTPPVPLRLREGSADVHHHMFDEQAFGGRWRNGTASGVLQTCDGHGFWPPPHGRIATLLPVLGDLAGCPSALATLQTAPGALAALALASNLGPAAFSELIGKIEGSGGDTGFHVKRRSPGSGWPRWDSMVHQRGHRNALFKAHQDGLELIVVTTGGFAPFCELLPVANNYGCDEMADVDRQIALAHQFASDNASWVQIALGPQDAMNIINSGKLAMVIAIETTDLFNTLFTDPGNPPDAAAIAAVVQKYYDPPYDVRAVQLAHETDNGFAGAALINPLFEVFQFAHNRYGPSCVFDADCARPRLGFDVYEDGDGVCKNARGLTPAGELLVQALMDKGMLIDLAHLPERGILRTYQLAKQRAYYPLFHSHTKFRELEPLCGADPHRNHGVIEHSVPAWVVQKIRRTGGLVGLRIGYLEQHDYTPSGVSNTCAGSSRSLAQAYEFGRQGLKVPMAMGSDLNAFTQNTRPRFLDRSLPGKPKQNPNGACSAGFRAEGICQARMQTNKLGTAYDRLGLADTGLEVDVLKDLEHVGLSSASVAPIRYQSAEQFVRMWLRANDLPQPRTGPADLANDIDLSGIAPYRQKALREKDYPSASCFGGLIKPRYCPNSEQMGDPCRFDGECAAPLICGGFQPFCGLPEGTCVCHGKDLGCPSGQYCKLRNPLTAADNECRPKKDPGAPCLTKKECKSNQCKFTLNPFGPHCT